MGMLTNACLICMKVSIAVKNGERYAKIVRK